MTKKLVVSASLLAKSQVASYTRSDGTVVQSHDNGRQAAAPEPINHKVLAKLKPAAKPMATATKPNKDSSLLYMNTTKSVHQHLLSHVDDLKKKGYKVVHEHHESGGISDDNSGASRSLHSHYFMENEKGDKAVAYRAQTKAFNGGAIDDRHYQEVGVKHGGDLPDVSKQRTRAMSSPWGKSGSAAAGAKKLAVRASVAKQATAKPSSAAPQKAADAAPGPMTPDAVKEHALQSGAKWKSSVAVFSRPESAHSFAEKAATSKGSAFVMKHPNHAHHVVVGGADSQRMSKNGYEYVRPVMKGRGY